MIDGNSKFYDDTVGESRADRIRSRGYNVRVYNNWVKLLCNYMHAEATKQVTDAVYRVVELGSGKGGDLGKWKAILNSKDELVSIDSSTESISEGYRRFGMQAGGFKYIAEVGDMNTVVLPKNVSLLVIHFAFQYMHPTRYEGFFLTLAQNMYIGGRLLITVPYLPMALGLVSSGSKNDGLFSASSIETDATGALSYAFKFTDRVDVREYFVMHKELFRVAAKYGFDVVWNISFPDFVKKHKRAKGYRKNIRAIQLDDSDTNLINYYRIFSFKFARKK